MEDKKGEKTNLKELKEILSNMHEYLTNNNHGFYSHLLLGYCNTCQSVVGIGGDYTKFSGRDCFGNHYETVHNPTSCLNCRSGSFIKISPKGLNPLEEQYKERTADILIRGIESGMEKMTSPTLYNEQLPEIYDKWKKLNMKKKRQQIANLLEHNKKINEAKKKVKELESILD